MPVHHKERTSVASTADLDKRHLDQVFDRRLDRLRIRHLRLLEWVAQTGSLSAAAEGIGISQPAATKLLQELEHAFACKLIERTPRGGVLTGAGHHVLGRMKIALNCLDLARNDPAPTDPQPLVRLGILPVVGIHALAQVVAMLKAKNQLPRIQIQLGTVPSLLQALSEGKVDCVVGRIEEWEASDNIREFQVTPLWEESLVVVADPKHPLTKRKSISLETLLDNDWVLMPKGTSSRRSVERLFLEAGLPPPVPRIETDSFYICLSLVTASKMLTVTPMTAFEQYAGKAGVLQIERTLGTGTLVFVTLAGMPMMQAVQDLSGGFQDYARSIAKNEA